MTEGKDENLLRAIDSIELDMSVQRRMYENILEKAERKSRLFRTLRIVKPAVSAAACVCLVIAAALLLKIGINNSDSFSGGIDVSMRDKSAAADNASAENIEILTTAAAMTAEITTIIHYRDAEVVRDGSADYAYTEAESVYDDIAENTSMITTAFDFSLEAEEAESINGETTVSPGIAGISDEISAEGAAPSVFDISSVSSSLPDFNAGGEESENIFDDYVDAVVSSEDVSVTLPDDSSYVPCAVPFSGLASEVISTGFTYEDHFYTVTVYLPAEITEAAGVIYEDIGGYSDSNAVMCYTEKDGAISYQVRWSNEKYLFLLINNDGADRKKMIEVSTEIIINNR